MVDSIALVSMKLELIFCMFFLLHLKRYVYLYRLQVKIVCSFNRRTIYSYFFRNGILEPMALERKQKKLKPTAQKLIDRIMFNNLTIEMANQSNVINYKCAFGWLDNLNFAASSWLSLISAGEEKKNQ